MIDEYPVTNYEIKWNKLIASKFSSGFARFTFNIQDISSKDVSFYVTGHFDFEKLLKKMAHNVNNRIINVNKCVDTLAYGESHHFCVL